jgi:hypothetical protein
MNASFTAHPLTATRSADPAPRLLALPGIERGAAYAAASGLALLRGWLRPHALHSQRAGRYQADFTLTPSLRNRWHAFFRSDATREIPYLFHTSAATLLAARLLADLGLNLRRVTPLRQVVAHVRDADPLGQVPQQRLDCRLQRVTQLATGMVAVVLQTTISDPHGQLLATQDDHFSVSHLDTALLPELHRCRITASDFALLRCREARITMPDANVGEWLIGADWGRHFARLSGALSPAHGSRLLSLLAGQAAPTLPVACLRNLLVRQLADSGLRSERLDISFCRPVYLNQRITIAQRDSEFEVSDARGVLLAFGRC